MHARDASGRQVSLLNDDALAAGDYRKDAVPHRLSYRTANRVISQAYRPPYSRSDSSSPNTPELFRSDSYDSQMSNDPISPLTPNALHDYSRTTVYPTSASEARSPYDDYMGDVIAHNGAKRPGAFSDSRSSSYEDDAATSPTATTPSDRSGKRYPCRYRDTHGCEKTFTTSGHASRHSKIHTAEKAVHCTFPGCTKKFTRADNMKQHLETHFKDKSRSSSARQALSASDRRHSSSSKSSSRNKATTASASTPLQSAGTSDGTWDMRALNLPLMSRPIPMRNPSSGLDALAMAIACQEGS